METTANTALELYSRLRNYNVAHRTPDYPLWVDAMHVFESEWTVWSYYLLRILVFRRRMQNAITIIIIISA